MIGVRFCLATVGVVALPTSCLASAFIDYEGPGDVFEFSQMGFSDAGVFTGAFIAEDLDGNGQIESFAGEIFDIHATYLSGLVNTEFDFDSLEFPEGGALTGLVYSLDGKGTIGDDQSRAIEGFALDNGDYYYASGPGPFQFCDGINDCGYIAEIVPFDDDGGGFDGGGDDPFAVFDQVVVADTPELVRVTSGPIGNSGAGSTEDNPLLPDPDSGTDGGGFVFTLPEDVVPGQLVFIDPEITVGYDYEVDGSAFASVAAPLFATVPDADGYTLLYDGMAEQLDPGEEFFFAPGSEITAFSIIGIDPALGLDPDDPLAFVTGVSLGTITGTVTITQTPITTPVPLPASVLVLLTGLGGLGLVGRRTGRA